MCFVRAGTAVMGALLLFSGCSHTDSGRASRSASEGEVAVAPAQPSLGNADATSKQPGAVAAGSAEQPASTTREPAPPPTNFSQLKAQRAEPATNTDASTAARLAETEEKLAGSLARQSQLEQENLRLRTEIDRMRIEHGALIERLNVANQEKVEAHTALAKLQAERVASRTSGVDKATPPATAATPPAALKSLRSAQAPPADVPTAAEGRPTGALTSGAPTTASPAAAGATKGRHHVIRSGDTLEKISQQYYGTPERWTEIYEANRRLLGEGQPLRPGMELELPPK